MAMLKYGSAVVVEPNISQTKWHGNVKTWKVECDKKGCRIKTAKTVLAKYSPKKYILSHCTIIAAVETELADPNNPKSDYYIHPAYSNLVNNNGDAWSKKMLAACYRTFIGANNFLEHVQIPELSKGKVVDAVLREVPIGKDKNGEDLTTYYVDILVATERKHKELVKKIESKQLTTLSMGCFVSGTEITMADGTKRNIEEVQPGDLVLTHTGKIKPVMHVQKRWHSGAVNVINVEGDYKTTYVTSEHPFWAFKKESKCACGCGESIKVKLRGDRMEDGVPMYSRFKPGHYARVRNPNSKMYSLDEYKLLKDSNPIQEKMSLSWINAENLETGDIVSYPKSKEILSSDDATIEKARLIGYFLAEGSFVKEVIVEGKENDYGIRCRICGNIYNQISTHLPVHKITLKEYLSLYPDAPVRAKIQKKIIRTKSRLDNLNIDGLKRSRKKIGVEFSLGAHEKNTLNKEIELLAKEVFPDATILSYKKCIKIIGDGVASFFEKYGGEYFNRKRLPLETLYWDPCIQRHLVSTWIIGDLNTTGSKDLADQLHFILARLNVMHNLFKVKKSQYKTDLKKRTADGTVVTKHYEGIRSEAYMIQLNYQGFNALSKELNYAFKFKNSKRLNNVSSWAKNIIKKNWKNSNKLKSVVRPIKSLCKTYYEGWVYNFSVKDDESYVANDISVHNCKIAYSICSKCGNKAADDTEACDHVKYEKNNTFYDANGVQRKVAELCGHFSEPESVTFIDASWVANPAFTGAVIRNIVNPPKEVDAKIEEANKKKGYEYQEDDFLKAAHEIIAQEEDTDKEPPPPTEGPKEDEEEEPAGEPVEDEKAPDEEPAEDMEAPTGEPEPPLEQNNVKMWKDRIKKKVLQELGDEIADEFDEEDEGGPRELSTLDENLIQPTASIVLRQLWKSKKLYNKYLDKMAGKLNKKSRDKLRFGAYMLLTSNDTSILSNYGYSRRDFLAVLSYIDRFFKNPLPLDLKRAVAVLETSKGLSLRNAAYALSKLAGRKVAVEELKKALIWLKLMDSYK